MAARDDESSAPPTAEVKRLAVTVCGRVQGVGYRFFTRDRAVSARLGGWVRNLGNGDVQLEVQGPSDRLDSFCYELKRGPALSHVSEIRKREVPVVEGETMFSIRH